MLYEKESKDPPKGKGNFCPVVMLTKYRTMVCPPCWCGGWIFVQSPLVPKRTSQGSPGVRFASPAGPIFPPVSHCVRHTRADTRVSPSHTASRCGEKFSFDFGCGQNQKSRIELSSPESGASCCCGFYRVSFCGGLWGKCCLGCCCFWVFYLRATRAFFVVAPNFFQRP